jgi:hypothetical protein
MLLGEQRNRRVGGSPATPLPQAGGDAPPLPGVIATLRVAAASGSVLRWRPFQKLSQRLSTKMKCAVLSAVTSIAFFAFAVLRPPVPAKPEPPFNGEPIIIEGDSMAGTAYL